ncbi:10671_t:CDS:2 [Cetraspora pellucida]|uniref:10671_t:CDS:1 n=1 Tax=Cetraspora pellucida TaxID=1433469 RepID=A0A9N9DXD4_9GLOM|nr:10671_t:CDS:2 [Cetraspora pellucida]
MSKKVVVYNISACVSEKTVKDFFLFCGKIEEFKLIKEESSDKQISYITFEREIAAKTAKMLTNAVIGDSEITVKSADDSSTDGISPGDKVKSDKESFKRVIVYDISASVSEKMEAYAKTAKMLTNALIGDSQIIVKSVDDSSTDGISPGDKVKSDKESVIFLLAPKR